MRCENCDDLAEFGNMGLCEECAEIRDNYYDDTE